MVLRMAVTVSSTGPCVAREPPVDTRSCSQPWRPDIRRHAGSAAPRRARFACASKVTGGALGRPQFREPAAREGRWSNDNRRPTMPTLDEKLVASEYSPRGPIAAVFFAAALALAGSTIAFAAEKQEGSRAAEDCAANPGTAATPPPSGPSSGTAPGGEGSTGWTGGTGGSNIGTTPGAPTPSSKTEHRAAASGLDPTKSTTESTSAGAGC
jgi:hypothetical protein